MKTYREVWIVDAIKDIDELLSLSVVGHTVCANKDAICTVIMGFVQPRLQEICDRLAEDETVEVKKKCGKKKQD